MRYGKVVGGVVTNWLEIDPGDALKVQKATAKGYRPEEDIRPAVTEYQRLQTAGHDIQPGKLVKLYQVVAKSQAEIDAINLKIQKDEAVSTNLPGWSLTETAIKNAFPDPAQQNVMLKLARACYVHIKNSLV